MRTRRNGRAHFALAAFALSAAASVVRADDYRTPHAGEVAVGTIFGNEVRAPKRDRGRITYLNLGAVLLSGGPDGLGFGPAGGAYFWRAPEEGDSRCLLYTSSRPDRHDPPPLRHALAPRRHRHA